MVVAPDSLRRLANLDQHQCVLCPLGCIVPNSVTDTRPKALDQNFVKSPASAIRISVLLPLDIRADFCYNNYIL